MLCDGAVIRARERAGFCFAADVYCVGAAGGTVTAVGEGGGGTLKRGRTSGSCACTVIAHFVSVQLLSALPASSRAALTAIASFSELSGLLPVLSMFAAHSSA